jgi:hypothetical protein
MTRFRIPDEWGSDHSAEAGFKKGTSLNDVLDILNNNRLVDCSGDPILKKDIIIDVSWGLGLGKKAMQEKNIKRKKPQE